MPRARLFLEWLAILLLTLGFSAWVLMSGGTARFDNALLDRVLVRDAAPASDGILLVAIDERSLAAEGQWPWDRRKVAALIDTIDTARPRGILLDVLYTEPSDAEADAALAESLRKSGKVAVPLGIAPAANRSEGFDAVSPIPGITANALAVGHVGITPDGDGPVRRVALRLHEGKPGAPPLEHVALILHNHIDGHGGVDGASDAAMNMRPAGSYRSVPASAVLAGEVPTDFFKGKVVIVGATAEGLGDNFPVSGPAGAMMSGAELQANLYQNLSDGGFVADLGTLPALIITAFLIGALFLAFWVLRPVWCLMLAVGLSALAMVFSVSLAIAAHLWFPPGPALAGLFIAHPLWGWRRLATINHYLMGKADRLSLTQGTLKQGKVGGFDSLARAVNRLDFLVDELDERRAFLRRVVEATPDALCVFDAEARLMMMNQRARSVVGDLAHGSEGLTVDQLVARFGGQLDEAFSELTLPDGSIFVITRSTGLPEDRWPEINLAMFTDVTAQRRAEAERRQALEFLSHDMRAPQVAILGLTNQTPPSPSVLARIRTHARRTLQLADNFVELARLAETPLDLAEVDIAMLAEEAADRAYGLAQERDAAVQVRVPEEPVFLLADGQVLSRVLDNLVGNAVKYGATLVEIDVSESADGVMIAVADNGPGLPEERRTDPFARFGGRAEGRKSGAGLGLAFVSGAVERHGGQIACESSPGKGTRFVIDLPVTLSAE